MWADHSCGVHPCIADVIFCQICSLCDGRTSICHKATVTVTIRFLSLLVQFGLIDFENEICQEIGGAPGTKISVSGFEFSHKTFDIGGFVDVKPGRNGQDGLSYLPAIT